MNLIIGGTHQGKKQYAATTYNIPDNSWQDGATCPMESIYTTLAIHNFHLYLRRLLSEREDVKNFAEELFMKNPSLLIVTDEVGYGIVPIDREERIWREACGRVCTVLAEKSDSVVRVCCGIGQKIK